MARASGSIGYEVDEYRSREPSNGVAQFFDREITLADTRIKQLDSMVSDLKFLQTAMRTRVPKQLATSTGGTIVGSQERTFDRMRRWAKSDLKRVLFVFNV